MRSLLVVFWLIVSPWNNFLCPSQAKKDQAVSNSSNQLHVVESARSSITTHEVNPKLMKDKWKANDDQPSKVSTTKNSKHDSGAETELLSMKWIFVHYHKTG